MGDMTIPLHVFTMVRRSSCDPKIAKTTIALTRLIQFGMTEYFSQFQDTTDALPCKSWTLTAELQRRIETMEMR